MPCLSRRAGLLAFLLAAISSLSEQSDVHPPDHSDVDPDTPAAARTTTLLSNGGHDKFGLVFSDEFARDGRHFGEGRDGKWTAINAYNPATSDFQAYVRCVLFVRPQLFALN